MTTTAPAPNKYVEHFNAVLSNYAEALLIDGQGSERHQRAAQAVDVLMREYALATTLLDHVRNACFVQIERTKNLGGAYRATAELLIHDYPPIAEEIRRFADDDLATDAR